MAPKDRDPQRGCGRLLGRQGPGKGLLEFQETFSQELAGFVFPACDPQFLSIFRTPALLRPARTQDCPVSGMR